MAGRSAQDIGALLQKGVAAHRAGQITQAKNAYLKVIEAIPREPNANRLIGAVFLQEGQFDRARKHIEVAIRSTPQDAENFYFLGRVLLEQKHRAEAIEALRTCVRFNPKHLNGHIMLAIALVANSERQAALDELDAALALDPNSHDARYNKIDILSQIGRLDEAWALMDTTIRMYPNSADIRMKRGDLHMLDGNQESAVEDFRQALRVRPGDAKLTRRIDSTGAELCDWPDDGNMLKLAGVSDSKDDLTERQVGLHMIAWKAPPSLLLDIASRAWMDNEFVPAPPARQRSPGDRLRIGYVSSDLRQHAVGMLAASLFEAHDASTFDIVNYSILADDPTDALRQRIQAATPELHFVHGVRDQAFARLVADHKIDVLVDMNGFTSHSYLSAFQFRPAPVQINYLGYPGTSGAPFIDYIIGDPSVTPVGSDAEFSEKIIRLPDSYQPNSTVRAAAPITPSRSELGLPETGFVFCCFNASYKITDDAFDSWIRIVNQVEGSVLWLIGRTGTVKTNLIKQAVRRGLDPSRLIFAPNMPNADHLARHRHAGLFLDTFYYGAHTTAADALWMGVPVVTKIGPTFAGRVGASLNRAVGLPELVTESVADYEALALALANDPTRLAGLRGHLEAKRDTLPLFDAKRYTRHLEAAFVTAFERAARGEAPASFDVPPIGG